MSDQSVLQGSLWGSGHDCATETRARKGSPRTGRGMVKLGGFIEEEVKMYYWGGGLITQGQRGDHLGYRTERLGKTSDSGQETKIDYVSWTP